MEKTRNALASVRGLDPRQQFVAGPPLDFSSIARRQIDAQEHVVREGMSGAAAPIVSDWGWR